MVIMKTYFRVAGVETGRLYGEGEKQSKI